MKLPRPASTVRRLMILVVLVGLLIWSALVVVRWNEYRRQAKEHEIAAEILRAEFQSLSKEDVSADWLRRIKESIANEAREARRYRRAESLPWLSITSIPREPL